MISHFEWEYVGPRSILVGPRKNKKIFYFLFSIICLIIFREDEHFENHINFAYLIKGHALESALCGRSILQWKIEEDRWNRGWLHQIRGRLLTWEAKVVCFLKIWWRLNEALLNYLEAINIGMKPTLMKERRFDDIHGDQGWNMCSPCNYIIKKVYL